MVYFFKKIEKQEEKIKEYQNWTKPSNPIVISGNQKEKSNNSEIIKRGDVYYARTHSDFLNQVFARGNIPMRTAGWKYAPNILVWMVRFSGERGGFSNRIIDENRLVECYVGKSGEWRGKPVQEEPEEEYRIVVMVEDCTYTRKYIIKGLYKFNRLESSLYKRVFNKVADEITVYKKN